MKASWVFQSGATLPQTRQTEEKGWTPWPAGPGSHCTGDALRKLPPADHSCLRALLLCRCWCKTPHLQPRFSNFPPGSASRLRAFLEYHSVFREDSSLASGLHDWDVDFASFYMSDPDLVSVLCQQHLLWVTCGKASP